jgi:uncharacterized protein (DUF58 family)
MSVNIEPFQYRVAQLGYRAAVGAHRSQMFGCGQLFKHHDSLFANPDPRRLDLRASVLDPFDGYRVKVFQQHAQLRMIVIADFSLSMTFSGKYSKRQFLADFLLSSAFSAAQTGDSFSFIGCGSKLDYRWIISTTHRFDAAPTIAQQLVQAPFKGHAESLLALRPLLPSKRALVFLVSDFHFPLPSLKRIMAQFSAHAVVPIVLWDESEYKELPEWGIIKLKDLEHQQTKTLFMRPAYKQKIMAAFAQRKRDLQNEFRSFAAEPVFLEGRYQAQKLTAYFQGRAL